MSRSAQEWARIAALDCLGVAIAGSREECSRIAAGIARAEKAREEATVLGHGFASSAERAAFVNGISAHASDFDHSFIAGGQPTAAILPAVLALGEAIGASGRQVVDAYLAGFEIAAGLALADMVPGALGAAAACAKLLEVEVDRALAIAQAVCRDGGLAQGTMGKPLRVGLAARHGVLAARLAKAGFDAGSSEFSKFRMRGALEKYGVRLKPYPCGGLTHTAIYAAIELRESLSIEAVERIEVRVPQHTAQTIRYRIPENRLQAKFSMPYLVARALMDGAVTLAAFSDSAVHDARAVTLMEKVEMTVDPELPSSESADGSRAATVVIRLADGKVYERGERFPKGSPQVPMTEEELRGKVRNCGLCEPAIEMIGRLETLPSISPLADLLKKS